MPGMFNRNNVIPVSPVMRSIGVGGMASILHRSLWIALAAAIGAGIFAPPAIAQEPSTGNASKKIERGDIIRVDVAGRQDLSGLYTVDANGMITLPMVGSVSAA